HNLRAAEIQATDADIQGIIEKGFLSRILDFERVIAGAPPETVPDYLHGWGPENSSEAASMPDRPDQAAGMDKEQTLLTTSAEKGASVFHAHASISATAPLIQTRRVSPVELTEQALARTAERGPVLNAFQYIMADRARAAARRAEQAIAAGNY